MKLSRLIMLLIWLFLVPGLLVACNGDDEAEENPTTAPANPTQAATEPSEEASAIEVGLSEFEITMPSTISAGMVTFNVTNNGTEEHSFEIEGNGVEEELENHLQPGETGSLTIELAPGIYEVYCSVEDHAAQGMQLELTVQ